MLDRQEVQDVSNALREISRLSRELRDLLKCYDNPALPRAVRLPLKAVIHDSRKLSQSSLQLCDAFSAVLGLFTY